MSKLHVGYFAELNSRATLLIEADADGFRELGQMFESLASGRIKRLVLHRIPFARVHHAIELRALCGSSDRGARHDGADNSFLWEFSRLGWRGAAERLVALAEAPRACHHVFDAEQEDLVVVVSKGEYGDAWWTGRADPST